MTVQNCKIERDRETGSYQVTLTHPDGTEVVLAQQWYDACEADEDLEIISMWVDAWNDKNKVDFP